MPEVTTSRQARKNKRWAVPFEASTPCTSTAARPSLIRDGRRGVSIARFVERAVREIRSATLPLDVIAVTVQPALEQVLAYTHGPGHTLGQLRGCEH